MRDQSRGTWPRRWDMCMIIFGGLSCVVVVIAALIELVTRPLVPFAASFLFVAAIALEGSVALATLGWWDLQAYRNGEG